MGVEGIDDGADPVDRLLERLNRGDPAAAEQVFRTYEPYLRMLVHRQLRPPLRAKFDSMDVVQSVWADVLQGVRAPAGGSTTAPTSGRSSPGWPATGSSTAAASTAAPWSASGRWPSTSTEAVASVQPRPSEVAQRNELWDQMLALCPPAHHELLRLKSQGLPLAEIAARTGLHEGSVRRILYDLAARVAAAREAGTTPVRAR